MINNESEGATKVKNLIQQNVICTRHGKNNIKGFFIPIVKLKKRQERQVYVIYPNGCPPTEIISLRFVPTPRVQRNRILSTVGRCSSEYIILSLL